MLILGLLGMYFHAVVVFVTSQTLLSKLAVAILLSALIVTSRIEISNSPILEFKVLQNAFKIKEQGLTYFLK